MMRSIQWCLLLLMSLPATGCMTLSQPKVSIESVEVVDEADLAAGLLFHGRIKNPHEKTLRLLEFTYSVSVQGRSVYHGRHAAEMTLTPGADRTISLPAAFTDAAAGLDSSSLPASSRWSLSGSLLFLSEGVLAETLLDMGFRPTVGFSASGDLQWQGAGARAQQ